MLCGFSHMKRVWTKYSITLEYWLETHTSITKMIDENYIVVISKINSGL